MSYCKFVYTDSADKFKYRSVVVLETCLDLETMHQWNFSFFFLRLILQILKTILECHTRPWYYVCPWTSTCSCCNVPIPVQNINKYLSLVKISHLILVTWKNPIHLRQNKCLCRKGVSVFWWYLMHCSGWAALLEDFAIFRFLCLLLLLSFLSVGCH